MDTDGRAPVTAAPRRHAGRSLTGRASLNAVASGLDYAVRAVVELVVTPLLVAGLGAATYGAWRVLWQWSSYVWGASGRSAQALQYAIAHRQWTATEPEKRELVGAALVVWVLFLPLLLLVGGLGVWAAPHLLDVTGGEATAVRGAAALLALDALVVTLVTVPRSVLQGENLGYARMGISTVLVALGGVLLALAVELGLGLPGVAGATVVTTLLTGWLFWVVTRRRLPWFGMARPARATVRWFLGLSAWFLGWKLVLELMVASDVLVLAAVAPLSAVAAFAVSKWVADSLAQALSLLVQATIPGIGGYLGAGDLTKAAALRGEVLSLVWLVGTAVGAAVIVWNGVFVELWVGERLFAGHSVSLLVVVLAFQLALIKADTFIIDVALVPRIKVVVGTAAAVVSVVLAVVIAGPLDGGVAGLCVGLVLGRAVLGLGAPLAVGRLLGVPAASQLRSVLRPALVTGLVFGGGAWLGRRHDLDSWGSLLTGGVATVVVATAVAGLLGLDRRQRDRLIRRARMLMPRTGGGDA